jgi:SAM-dependent methyltransferase
MEMLLKVMTDINSYNNKITQNLQIWNQKPLLRLIYNNFYKLIAKNLFQDKDGYIVELGSGIGKIKSIIPNCICTDVLLNPYIDKKENAYKLDFEDSSVSNLILFDVFHHLEYPGEALSEFYRVLVPSGRVLIFEPAISLLGLVIYGLLHPEPLGIFKKIKWDAPSEFSSINEYDYYVAQANATRIFFSNNQSELNKKWNVIEKIRLSAISYVAAGGYKKIQLYPLKMHPVLTKIDKFCDKFPWLFATRMLITLEKKFHYRIKLSIHRLVTNS